MAKRKTTKKRAKTTPRFSFRKERAEFRPDSGGTGFLKLLHLTEHQRVRLLRWSLYVAVCIAALVIQDVIMSRMRLFGGTTDLFVSVILLMTVLEGCETGSLLVLIASTLYWFSGSAPGPYCVGLLTVLGMIAALFRQKYWHRSAGSIILCAGIAMIAYELSLHAVGLFYGLTRWGRLNAFFTTGILGALSMIPLYPLIFRIGQIGGNTWKE